MVGHHRQAHLSFSHDIICGRERVTLGVDLYSAPHFPPFTFFSFALGSLSLPSALYARACPTTRIHAISTRHFCTPPVWRKKNGFEAAKTTLSLCFLFFTPLARLQIQQLWGMDKQQPPLPLPKCSKQHRCNEWSVLFSSPRLYLFSPSSHSTVACSLLCFLLCSFLLVSVFSDHNGKWEQWVFCFFMHVICKLDLCMWYFTSVSWGW